MIGAPQPGQLTTRQRYETAHAVGGCKVCHLSFDPIGYGFENFDEVGRFREQEGGLPVNAVSYVPTEDGQGHLFDFANLEELARGLAAEKLPYQCATAFVSTYINGSTEACLGETKRGAFIDQQLGFVDYFASLAAEPHFVKRELQASYSAYPSGRSIFQRSVRWRSPETRITPAMRLASMSEKISSRSSANPSQVSRLPGLAP